jgi:hypothetical protein
VTHDEMVQNIIEVYNSANENTRKRGRSWYRRGTLACSLYAHMLGISTYQAAGVYAAYSINNKWGPNMKSARKVLRGRAPFGLPDQIKVARAALRGDIIDDVMGKDSFKVKRFARNLSGDFSVVTVDRWARRIAYNDASLNGVPKGKEYLAIEQAYISAAAIVGELPAEIQAITWLVVSRKG